MRTRILKKATAFMLAAAMTVSMAGCGKGGSDGSKGSSKDTDTNTKDMVYAAEELNVEGYEGELSEVYVLNGKMYISTYEWVEGDSAASGDEGKQEEGAEGEEADKPENDTEASEGDAAGEKTTETGNESEEAGEETTETGDEAGEETTETADEDKQDESDEIDYDDGYSIQRMYTANLDGSDLKEISLPEMGNDAWLQQMFVLEDGTFNYLYGNYDYKKNMSTYSIVQADESGKILSNEDVTETLKFDSESYISKILCDNKGNYIFILEKSVSVLSPEGKLLFELKNEENVWMETAVVTKDGQILVGSSGGEDKPYVQSIDIEGKKWGEKYEIDIQYFSSSDSLMTGGGDYDFYYKDDSGVYGYILADKKGVKIIDYMASNIDSNHVYNMTPYEDGKFISSTWDDMGQYKVFVYSKVDPSTIADKEKIVLTMLWLDDDVKRAAMEFNKNNDKYQIEIKDYSSVDDAKTKFNADLIAGNVGDIISVSDLPAEQYIAKGLLEDLTPYFEKDDAVSLDDMIDSLREATMVDGKMYYVTSSFNVNTLTASAKVVGTTKGWTFDDMKKLLDEKGSSARPFYAQSKESMLYSFAGSATSDFVDWSTGECSFDSQDFKSILEICNRGTAEEEEWSEDSESYPSQIQSGKILFETGSISVDELQMYEAIFGGDITFIGYPAEDKEGSYFTLGNSMGIYSKSKVKDGAWEFLRTIMTKEYQGKQVSTSYMWNLPSRKDAMDLKFEIVTATEKFTDEYGTEHEPMNYTSGFDDMEYQVKPLTQKQVDQFMDLVNSTKKIGGWNEDIMNIIIEESKAYFQGDKGLDETADLIQNRVKTYVNENR